MVTEKNNFIILKSLAGLALDLKCSQGKAVIS